MSVIYIVCLRLSALLTQPPLCNVTMLVSPLTGSGSSALLAHYNHYRNCARCYIQFREEIQVNDGGSAAQVSVVLLS